MNWITTLLVAVLALTACEPAPGMVLVPSDEVVVYEQQEGTTTLGKSSDPLQVVQIIYPDKTDYVVQVQFKGTRGYVRNGAFDLKPTAALSR